jgi:beta-glucosidase
MRALWFRIVLPMLAACVLASQVLPAAEPAVKEPPAKKKKAGKTAVKRGGDTTAPVDRKMDWWMKRQTRINENVKQGDAQLLFIGDSITQGWEGAGKDVWQKHYGKRHAVNLGIGGDQTQHVLWRLEHGNLEGIKPKLAVLMIGTNNASAGNTPSEIAAGVKAIIGKIRATLPETKVLVLAIFPRGADADDPIRKITAAANLQIARLADHKNVFYLDIGKNFLGPEEALSKDIMPDLLHLSPKGYEIWATSIEPVVSKYVTD